MLAYYLRITPDDFAEAVSCFENAIEIDLNIHNPEMKPQYRVNCFVRKSLEND